MNVYIVIPTYDEADNISRIIEMTLSLHSTFNIIVVDDNSPDGTGAIANDLSRIDSRVSVIHRPHKMGLGTAYVEGFKYALSKGADLILEMDADLSHDPKYIQSLLDASVNADLVIGSRYKKGVSVEGWPFRRLLISKFANMYVSHITVMPVWDSTAGFRCYRRRVFETIDLDSIKSDGYAFQIEMTYLIFRHGYKIIEVPILFKEREHGTSKISRKVLFEALWLTLKCHAPLWQITKNLWVSSRKKFF